MSTNEDFDSYRDELMSMGAKIGLVTNTREAMNIKELSTTKGEYLEASTLQLNEYETDRYFLQNFQCTTLLIHVFCKILAPIDINSSR